MGLSVKACGVNMEKSGVPGRMLQVPNRAVTNAVTRMDHIGFSNCPNSMYFQLISANFPYFAYFEGRITSSVLFSPL
jgi:hypothetical protein